MKMAIILGTRPEIIKMSFLIVYCHEHGSDHFSLHTGQHYSFNMDRLFFQDIDLPEPRYNMNIGSGSHAEETAKMIIGIEKILLKERSHVILVQGDTNIQRCWRAGGGWRRDRMSFLSGGYKYCPCGSTYCFKIENKDRAYRIWFEKLQSGYAG